LFFIGDNLYSAGPVVEGHRNLWIG